MDFWGFEGRHELPGDGFGLFKETPINVKPANNSTPFDVKVDLDEKTKDDPSQVAEAVKGKLTPDQKKAVDERGADLNWMDAIEGKPEEKATGKLDKAPPKEAPAPKDAPAPGVNKPESKDKPLLTQQELDQTGAKRVPGLKHAVYEDAEGHYYVQKKNDKGEPVYHEVTGEAKENIQSKIEKTEKKKEREDDPEAIRARREGTAAIIGNVLGGAAALKAASSYGSGSSYGGGPAAGYGWGGSFGGGGLGSFGSCGGLGGGGGGFGGGFGGLDLTGTGFGIQQAGGDYREDARKTENLLKMLIMMIACGNVDAITSAFIMLSQKSKQTLIKASLQMINAMRQYDNQMREMSDAMGKLNSKDPEYQSKLSEFNSKFQTASGGRQMIMNMGRDIMSSVEEFNNVEKSVLDQMTRSRQTYSRWT